jgi:hypothetical protein
MKTRQQDELERTIRSAWSAETSSDPTHWTATNPAWGQCAVTALVVQDEFGGQLERTTVCGISHYFNRLQDGRVVDLTLEQFDEPRSSGVGERRDRSYVLGFPDTRRRYDLLRDRIYATISQ